jgi:3-hydroxyisobutyrate dehydrogenase-like beta-hydroxyacid dehydrogenase
MGASVGAAARSSGADVIWAGGNRSQSTHERANKAGLRDCTSFENMAQSADIILSVCPPHDAQSTAQTIFDHEFKGLFADCNAIAPQSSRQIGALFDADRFIDGGIIGGPAWNLESGTKLYLSGPRSTDIASLFEGSALQTTLISEQIGAASAIKMVFAAYTKGSIALLSAILGVAEKEGVRDLLEHQWGEAFTQTTHKQLVGTSAKAWRFAGEMREIASTFEQAGMPDGFHEAAAETFEKLAAFKDSPAEDIERLLIELLKSD